MLEQIALLWQPCPTGARVLRVFGDSPCPVLPESIAGVPVTEIGPYCFSAREPATNGKFWSPDGNPPAVSPHAICGDFIEEVTLPASLQALHNAAFYNCRSLRIVSVGGGTLDVGSDLFTNCRALQLFTVRAWPQAPTGLRRLLGAVGADVMAAFCPEGQPLAQLFFPEYSEYLDENTPAHIFNRSIQGIGYRYRQCFAEETLLFAEYDAAFIQADAEEPPASLCRVALNRLLFPYNLRPENRARYEAYLRAHPIAAYTEPIAAHATPALRLLAGLLEESDRRAAALACGRAGWGEGAALLLAASAPQTSRHTPKRYDFSDLDAL